MLLVTLRDEMYESQGGLFEESRQPNATSFVALAEENNHQQNIEHR